MIYIVTPCSRPENLERVRHSIHFDKIDKWFIVYDNRKCEFKKKYSDDDPQIVEMECHDEGIAGHQCRNKALECIEKDGFVYFVDDDNVIHSNFWNFVFDPKKALVYTFDQQLNPPDSMFPDIRTGSLPFVDQIDMAQYVVHTSLVSNRRFLVNFYNADGRFVEDIVKTHASKWKYIPEIGCYYNFLKITK